jgi:hypothetical protein
VNGFTFVNKSSAARVHIEASAVVSFSLFCIKMVTIPIETNSQNHFSKLHLSSAAARTEHKCIRLFEARPGAAAESVCGKVLQVSEWIEMHYVLITWRRRREVRAAFT